MDQVILNVDQRKEDRVDAPSPRGPVKTESEAEPRHTRLASLIQDKLSLISRDTLNYGTVNIYRVPEKHRCKNPEAYTPRLVSIGFIHYGESQLQGMEEHKLRYLHNFIRTFGVTLNELSKFVHDQEKLVCSCYEDVYVNKLTEQYHSDLKPSEVILLDAIFVIELFLKNHFLEMREKGRDVIFENPSVANDVLHDLLLFENQLPWRFLSALYTRFVYHNVMKCLKDHAIYPPSFNELAHKYFKNVGNTGKLLPIHDDSRRGVRHMVEFLSILHSPDKGLLDEWNAASLRQQEAVKKSDFAQCPTATELKAAGVKFKPGTKKCLLDVRFDREKGVLTIPQLTVNDSTETFFRNLIAFEQSGYHPKFITSYVILLDNLIEEASDVEVLMDSKIMMNEPGSSKRVADLFNNLYKEFVTDPKEFYYVEQCCQLKDYSRDWWHSLKSKWAKWWAILGKDYFNSPWSGFSVAAAVVLLLLTIAQTVCSILQVVPHHA